MIAERDLQALERIELALTRRLEGARHGEVRGWLPGPGLEPGIHRPYVPGDDVRHLDWNLTARTAQAHVRERVQEHDIDVWALVDASASMDFGTARCTKHELSVAAVAAFGLPAVRAGGRLGGVLAGAAGRDIMPPRGGMLHLHAVLRRVRTATPAESSGGRTDLVPGLRRVAALAQRRSLMVVVTDLLVASGWRQALAVLAARHEVVVVELVDPREVTLPAVGILTLVDPETGRSRTVDTSSRRVRERFTEVAAAHRRHAAETVRDAGAHHLALGTDRDWVRDVVRFLAARRRQVAAGAGSRP